MWTERPKGPQPDASSAAMTMPMRNRILIKRTGCQKVLRHPLPCPSPEREGGHWVVPQGGRRTKALGADDLAAAGGVEAEDEAVAEADAQPDRRGQGCPPAGRVMLAVEEPHGAMELAQHGPGLLPAGLSLVV